MPAQSPREVAATLSEAQKHWLGVICRTSGGGIGLRCRTLDDGEVVPSLGPLRKLFDKDLIQGKSGAFERVVHTRLGWSVNAILQEGQS